MTKKKPEPNPIEEAIGNRAKTTKDIPPIVKSKQFQKLAETQDVPSPSEMLTLEELNRQTEERLRDEPTIAEMATLGELGYQPKAKVPVLQPDHPPVTKTSSPESPPQKIEKGLILPETVERVFPCKVEHKIEEIDEYQDAEKKPQFELKEEISIRGCSINPPAEDIELTNLRKYILEDGFVLATVAFHIVSLCAQPMTTPSTTTWDFKDRAMIPDMVLALLNQPGYLEGIWPSLKIVMGSNKGNAAWTAGIATTIAFFDVVRTLPAIEELKNDTEKKS